MDNTRLFLFAALVFVGMLLWQQWQADYGPQPQPQVSRKIAAIEPHRNRQPVVDDLPDLADTVDAIDCTD